MPAPTFTPLSALIGGVLIGAAASLLLLARGRAAGISGIDAGLLHSSASERGWRVQFLLGLLAGGAVMSFVVPAAFGAPAAALHVLALSGVLVGFGARLGGGCTSGHGVVGVSGLSRTSLIATATFVAAGALSVLVVRLLSSGVGT